MLSETELKLNPGLSQSLVQGWSGKKIAQNSSKFSLDWRLLIQHRWSILQPFFECKILKIQSHQRK